jgi:hypothetical protein
MPVEIRAYDGAGRGLKMRWSNYLGSRERTGEALIMDNYGGFALIDDGTYDASLFDCETSVELGDQREFTRSDFIDHVAALGAPHIELIGDVGSAEIRQVMRYLAALPPDVLASIDKISYEQPAELNERCSKDAAACAAGRTIYLTRSKTDMGVFYHESAHVLHYALNRRGSAFEKKWLAANGAPYGNLSRPISLGYVWCDPSSADIGKPGMDDELLLRGLASEASGPRYGFAGAYGNKNCLEDVADFVRLFREAPDEFRPLIDRGDPKYDANYGDVYRAKLRLLIEYGFIAVEEVPDWMFKCLYGQEQG